MSVHSVSIHRYNADTRQNWNETVITRNCVLLCMSETILGYLIELVLLYCTCIDLHVVLPPEQDYPQDQL